MAERELIAPDWSIEDDSDGLAVTLTATGCPPVRMFFTLPDAETFADDLAAAAAFASGDMTLSSGGEEV